MRGWWCTWWSGHPVRKMMTYNQIMRRRLRPRTSCFPTRRGQHTEDRCTWSACTVYTQDDQQSTSSSQYQVTSFIFVFVNYKWEALCTKFSSSPPLSDSFPTEVSCTASRSSKNRFILLWSLWITSLSWNIFLLLWSLWSRWSSSPAPPPWSGTVRSAPGDGRLCVSLCACCTHNWGETGIIIFNDDADEGTINWAGWWSLFLIVCELDIVNAIDWNNMMG